MRDALPVDRVLVCWSGVFALPEQPGYIVLIRNRQNVAYRRAP
jgi:hypothetical protein